MRSCFVLIFFFFFLLLWTLVKSHTFCFNQQYLPQSGMQFSESVSKFVGNRWAIFNQSLDDLIKIQNKGNFNTESQLLRQIKLEVAVRIKQLQRQKEEFAVNYKTIHVQKQASKICRSIIQNSSELKKIVFKQRRYDKLQSMMQKFHNLKQIPDKPYQHSNLKDQKFQNNSKSNNKFKSFFEKIPIFKIFVDQPNQKSSLIMSNMKKQEFLTEEQTLVRQKLLENKEMNDCSPLVAKLKTSWWKIHEFSLYDLASAQKELTNSLDYPQIKHQIDIRMHELEMQQGIQITIHQDFDCQIQIFSQYQNLREHINELKLNILKHKKMDQMMTEMAQKTTATSIEQNPQEILARIIQGEQVFQSLKLSTSEEEVALLKKDKANILSIFRSYRWKVYLYNLESILQIQRQVSQLKKQQVSQIMKFIADRIKFLKRKYENLKMIVQLLAFATKILQNMKAEVENYQIIRKAQ